MKQSQDARIAVVVSWILAPLWGMMAGFYLGTIWSQVPMVDDLNVARVTDSFKYGLLGLVLGIAFATVVTVVYPRALAKEAANADPHDH